MEYFFADSSFGDMLCLVSDGKICDVRFVDGDTREACLPDLSSAVEIAKPEWFNIENLMYGFNSLSGYFCLPEASDFRREVWKAVCSIPLGETATYGEIARRIGKPGAVRAVATAVASNRLAVVIPCHRVVRSDGAVGEYRWGAGRKKALIDYEKLLAAKG